MNGKDITAPSSPLRALCRGSLSQHGRPSAVGSSIGTPLATPLPRDRRRLCDDPVDTALHRDAQAIEHRANVQPQGCEEGRDGLRDALGIRAARPTNPGEERRRSVVARFFEDGIAYEPGLRAQELVRSEDGIEQFVPAVFRNAHETVDSAGIGHAVTLQPRTWSRSRAWARGVRRSMRNRVNQRPRLTVCRGAIDLRNAVRPFVARRPRRRAHRGVVVLRGATRTMSEDHPRARDRRAGPRIPATARAAL